MERLNKDSPLAAVLARDRESFNGRFLRARKLNRGLDADDFSGFLTAELAPLADALASRQPDRLHSAVSELYGLGLELVAGDLAGPRARSPLVVRTWRELLPALHPFLAEEPRLVAAALSNAAFNIERRGGAAGGAWLDLMLSLGPRCSTAEELLELGKVLAWRSGMAHYRAGAIEAWERLPLGLMRASLGLPEDDGRSRDELAYALSDPWTDPIAAEHVAEKKPAIVARVGGFRGFGGQFIEPPRVCCFEDTILAYDRDAAWSVHADCFGAVLERFGEKRPKGARMGGKGFRLDKTGNVAAGGARARFPALNEASSHAADGTTLAVTLPRSHQVFLVALV